MPAGVNHVQCAALVNRFFYFPRFILSSFHSVAGDAGSAIKFTELAVLALILCTCPQLGLHVRIHALT